MEGFVKMTNSYDTTRRLWLFGLALCLATALFSFINHAVSAASITVTNTNDSGAGSLRQALLDATPDTVIGFDASLTGQTITLASTLDIATALTIDASSAPNVTVSGNHSVRVFNITAPSTLIGFTVANGQAPSTEVGGGIQTSSALTLTLMHIANNQASSGGGIRASSGSVVVINQSTLSGNTVLHAGGGLFGQGNSVIIANSAIYSNTAAEDGGGLLVDSGELILHNSTVSGNQATQRGGGVWASITGATIRYSTLANNQAGISGGGLYVQGSGNVALDSTVIANSPNGGDCVGTVSGPGYNMIKDTANACGLTNGVNHNLIGYDPELSALGDHGGPTWTQINFYTGNLPNNANPATCPATDQRGFVRQGDNYCDIGATEADLSPTYQFATPADGATEVAVNSNLAFLFSEAVNAPNTAFSLQCPNGTPIAFAVLGSGTNTLTLDPTSDLPNGVTCTWTITGDQVTDVDDQDPPDSVGILLSGSFTTAAQGDTAPAVTGVTPANGATGVAVNTNIVFTFNEPVTGPTNGFRIECPVGTPIAFTDLGANTATRTLFPSSALPASTTCQVTLQADAISDVDNNDPPDHLASDYTTSFTTAGPIPSSVPNIFGTPNAQVVAGQAYTFQPGALDADGDPLTFSIQNKPAWASFDPTNGLLSGTPQAANVGTTTGIVISVSDGVRSAALPAFNLTVVATTADVNESPVLQNTQAPLHANVGQLYYFNPEGFDPDGDPLIYTIENKPSWASFDPQTGILQGTPTTNDVGAVEDVVIRVSEAGSVQAASVNAIPSSSTTVNIQVNDTASPIQPKSISFCISDPNVVEAQQVVLKAQKGWGIFWGLFGSSFISSEKKQLDADTYLFTLKPSSDLLENMAHGFNNPYTTIMKPTFSGKGDLELPVSAKLDANCAKPNILLLSRKNLGFTAVLGKDTQLSQSFTLEGSTETNLAWTAKVETLGDNNSLTLSAPSGTTKKGSPITLQINLAPKQLTTEPKTAKVVVTDGNRKTYEVVVEYEVKTESNSVAMTLTALEVTQGMQNQRNAMPLVQDRPTFVRAHVKSKTGTTLNKVTATLTVKDGNNQLLGTLYPANEGMNINVVPNPDRSKLNDSFLFQLKPEWLNRPLILEFAGNSNRADCKDINDTPNDCRATVSFTQVPALPVKFLLCTQTYKEGGVTKSYSGTQEEAQQMIQLLETFFPTPKVSATTAPWSVAQKLVRPTRPDRTLDPAYRQALNDLANLWTVEGSPKRHYIALCTQPQAGGGLANLDNVATKDKLDSPQVVFTSLGETLTAHEFEHNYGYNHPGSDGRFYPDYAQKSSISKTTDPANPDTYYGFVIKNNLFSPNSSPYGQRVIPPTGESIKDPVAYGFWLSDFTYREVLTLTQKVYPASSQTIASASATAETPVTFVSGSVTSITSGQLSTVYGQVAQGPISLPTAGEYALRLERANGTVVQTIPFSLQGLSEEATDNAGVQAAATTLGEFNFAIPYELNKGSEIAKLVLLHQGTVLDSITAPAAGAPDISGLVLNSHTTTVTAESTVRSSLNLHYWLEYQPAGSTTWHQVGSGDATPDATGQAALTIVIDKASLPGADSHRWRLLVSNGFYTSRTEMNAAFNIPNKHPTATMLTAFNGNQAVGDQTLVLEGAGNDLEDGELSGNSLIWHSNLDGEIGRGATLTVNANTLSEGEHFIWLEAIDSAGNSSITDVTETVGQPASASLPTAQAAIAGNTLATSEANVNQTGAAILEVYRDRPYRAPSLEPAGFGFTMDQGKTVTATLPIRNSGDGGALDWTVTATGLPSWMQLSQTGGQTPQNVVVTANASGVAPGTYTGTLTFQSNKAILNKTVTVPYRVELLAGATPPLRPVFLPLIRR